MANILLEILCDLKAQPVPGWKYLGVQGASGHSPPAISRSSLEMKPAFGWKLPVAEWKRVRIWLGKAYRTRLEGKPNLAGRVTEPGWKRMPHISFNIRELHKTIVFFLLLQFLISIAFYSTSNMHRNEGILDEASFKKTSSANHSTFAVAC